MASRILKKNFIAAVILFVMVLPVHGQVVCEVAYECAKSWEHEYFSNHLEVVSAGRVLSIPALGIDVEITTFYLGDDSWIVPPWETRAGHFEHTAWLETQGNVVLGAHSRYPSGMPGLFYPLDTLQIGDEIYVRDGKLQREYRVTSVTIVDFRDLSVLYPTMTSQLTLITCSIPSYVVTTGQYFERVVVIAEEVIEAYR